MTVRMLIDQIIQVIVNMLEPLMVYLFVLKSILGLYNYHNYLYPMIEKGSLVSTVSFQCQVPGRLLWLRSSFGLLVQVGFLDCKRCLNQFFCYQKLMFVVLLFLGFFLLLGPKRFFFRLFQGCCFNWNRNRRPAVPKALLLLCELGLWKDHLQQSLGTRPSGTSISRLDRGMALKGDLSIVAQSIPTLGWYQKKTFEPPWFSQPKVVHLWHCWSTQGLPGFAPETWLKE